MATQKKLVAGQSRGPNSGPVSFETNLMGQVVVSVIYLDACDKKKLWSTAMAAHGRNRRRVTILSSSA